MLATGDRGRFGLPCKVRATAAVLVTLAMTGCGTHGGTVSTSPSASIQPIRAATPRTSTAGRTSQSTVHRQHATPPPTWIRMVGGRMGWGLSAGHILRTSDGGATWVDVTPANMVAAQGGENAAFLGQEVAFIEMATRQGDTSPSTELEKTSNGGASWTSVHIPASAPDGLQMSFPSLGHGWALAHVGVGAGHDSVVLLSTSDGGTIWHRILATSPTGQAGLPDAGVKVGMTFQTSSRGWISGYSNVGGAYLYRTRDGGTSWTAQTLSLPSQLSSVSGGGNLVVLPPSTFGSTNAVLPVCAGSAGHGVLVDFYATHDGGMRWGGTHVLSLSGPSLCVGLQWSFADPSHGWVSDGKSLYTTTDGGILWSRSPLPGDNISAIQEVDFVSPTAGWILATSTSQRLGLFQTKDAGHTWSTLPG